ESRNLTSSKVASQGEHREEGLLRAGIDVRKDANPYTLHDKVMVIDETWVITGSYNFSNNAWRSNNENLLVLKSPELAQRYKKEVEALWEAGTPL
ncbi:MAG: phospholipase, partial [Thermus sp.]